LDFPQDYDDDDTSIASSRKSASSKNSYRDANRPSAVDAHSRQSGASSHFGAASMRRSVMFAGLKEREVSSNTQDSQSSSHVDDKDAKTKNVSTVNDVKTAAKGKDRDNGLHPVKEEGSEKASTDSSVFSSMAENGFEDALPTLCLSRGVSDASHHEKDNNFVRTMSLQSTESNMSAQGRRVPPTREVTLNLDPSYKEADSELDAGSHPVFDSKVGAAASTVNPSNSSAPIKRLPPPRQRDGSEWKKSKVAERMNAANSAAQPKSKAQAKRLPSAKGSSEERQSSPGSPPSSPKSSALKKLPPAKTSSEGRIGSSTEDDPSANEDPEGTVAM
jgi:hypothetical protein